MSEVDRLLADPEFMKLYQRARLETELTELICEVMKREKISRTELARRLGKSRAYVTDFLRDASDLTIVEIADVFSAMGQNVRILDQPLSKWTPRLSVVETDHPTQPSMTVDLKCDMPLGEPGTARGTRSYIDVTEGGKTIRAYFCKDGVYRSKDGKAGYAFKIDGPGRTSWVKVLCETGPAPGTEGESSCASGAT